MKKPLIALVIALICLLIMFLVFLINKKNYDIKIVLNIDNLSSKSVDSEIANELKDELLSITQVDEVLTYSYINKCSIYCKINPFCINKNEIKEKIKSAIEVFVLNYDKKISIKIDDKFDTIYNNFFIIYSTIDKRITLKNYVDQLEDEILDLNITSNLSFLAPVELAYYINFSTNQLKKYDITIDDIKNLIKENNLEINSGKFNSKNSLTDFETNSQIQNLDDIKKIPLFYNNYYKNNKFLTTFNDVFNIKEGVLEPYETLVFYKDYPGEILALKPKRFYFSILFNFKLNKMLNDFRKETPDFIKIEPIKNFKITQIYLDENSNIKRSLAIYNKIKDIDKNAIFIIGSNFIKTNRNGIYEKNPNLITVLSKNDKIKNYLKKEGIVFKDNSAKLKENYYKNLSDFRENDIDFATKKALKTDYIIDSILSSEYKLNKKEIVDSIIASTQGLIVDYCYKETNKIPIVLKNEDDFIYSKGLKVIVPLDSVVKKDIKKEYQTIARKNNWFYSLTFKD